MSSTPANAEVPSPAIDRVVVVGTSGAGKSTFARTLAARLDCPHVELDLIHWQSGWVERERPEFRAKVSQAIAVPKWIVDGNYVHARDLIWNRATTIIWLNYSFPIIFWRALSRTVRRIVRRETILNGNRETIGRSFFCRYGIPWWVVRTYRLRRREFSAMFAAGNYPHLRIIVFAHPADAERFLAELPTATGV
ncbi:MAG TPA: hypothetical protein VHY91_10015 [Pirellulales bacterium]|nr:hypothetical protein [Pirellulales bacterium]